MRAFAGCFSASTSTAHRPSLAQGHASVHPERLQLVELRLVAVPGIRQHSLRAPPMSGFHLLHQRRQPTLVAGVRRHRHRHNQLVLPPPPPTARCSIAENRRQEVFMIRLCGSVKLSCAFPPGSPYSRWYGRPPFGLRFCPGFCPRASSASRCRASSRAFAARIAASRS